MCNISHIDENKPEGDHELGELLLVELGHGPEHPLSRHPPKLGVCHGLLGHPHNLSYRNREKKHGLRTRIDLFLN